MEKPTTREAVVACVRSTWGAVLGLVEVGEHENFFDLGGDSYQATLAAAGLTKELGLTVLRLDIFECPTVLALVARVTNEMTHGTDDVRHTSGHTELKETSSFLPHQHPYFKRVRAIENGFTCQLALQAAREVSDESVIQALEVVLGRHEAMRCRYYHNEGSWRVGTVSVNGKERVWFVQAKSPPGEKELAAIAQSLREGVEPDTGNVLRVGVVNSGVGGTTLVLVAHHLAADTLSLEIFARELVETLTYGWGTTSADPRPTPVGALAWGERLCEYAASEASVEERTYWRTQEPVGPFALRRTTPDAEPVDARVTVSVDGATVTRLRDAVPMLKASLNEILISCVARAYETLTSSPDVVIASVMSGRETYFDGFGPTRTVGWVSYNVPYVIRFDMVDRWPDITSVLDQIRGIPKRGIGNQIFECGESADVEAATRLRELREACALVVNFMAEKASPLAVHGWSMLPVTGINRRPYVKHVRAVCLESTSGGWVLEWDFNTSYFAREAIEALAESSLVMLNELVSGVLDHLPS